MMRNLMRPVCLSVAMVVMLSGCGDSNNSPSPTPTPTPAPTTTTTILAGTFVGIPSLRFQTFDFAAPSAGTVTASAAWTFAQNDLDIYVVSGNSCNTTDNIGRPTGANCQILCQDIRVGGTQASCSLSATAGNARLFIVNLGATSESGTYTVTVTR